MTGGEGVCKRVCHRNSSRTGHPNGNNEGRGEGYICYIGGKGGHLGGAGACGATEVLGYILSEMPHRGEWGSPRRCGCLWRDRSSPWRQRRRSV